MQNYKSGDLLALSSAGMRLNNSKPFTAFVTRHVKPEQRFFIVITYSKTPFCWRLWDCVEAKITDMHEHYLANFYEKKIDD